ncbi:hypothetical protein [uncultured Vagococcus sp.]|uniref:hypothetical protein n=1 Tax=uncultured Vagococcus sp. TaxID=189676 RepID=UPI0028D756A2|nr:hypothetical protein [uncultured Vagococcus sp.]
MKIYCVAIVSGPYMMPDDMKVYKRKSSAIKRCELLNKERQDKPYKVLVADNWHEAKGND